jgi:Effector protein
MRHRSATKGNLDRVNQRCSHALTDDDGERIMPSSFSIGAGAESFDWAANAADAAGTDTSEEAAFRSAARGVPSQRNPTAPTMAHTVLADGRHSYATPFAGIYVTGRPDETSFPGEAAAALRKVALGPSGKNLLNDIAANSQGPQGKHVSIVSGHSPATRALLTDTQATARGMHQNDFSVDQNEIAVAAAVKKSVLGVNFANGAGAKAEITWNPDLSLQLNPEGLPYRELESGLGQSHVTLAHELVHALHYMKGDAKLGGNPLDESSPAGKEELRAIGLGKYAKLPFSENSIRQEHGLPLRTRFAGISRPPSTENPFEEHIPLHFTTRR